MKKIQNIQALRGIAVLSVVLFHLITIEKKFGGTTSIMPVFFEFGRFGVDLFFIISGFVMVSVTRGKFQNIKQSLHFLSHRILRIYPIYWVYTFFALIVFLINPSWVNSAQGNQVDILASFLLLPSEIRPLVQVGWTLIHEMYFYVVFFLILLITPERFMPIAILFWAVCIVFFNVSLESTDPFIKLIFHPLTLEFIGGCFLAITFFYESNRIISTHSLLLITLIGLASAIYGYYFYHQMTGQFNLPGWWRVLIFGVPAMLIVFCFINAEKNGYIINSLLVKIGDASYSIYLSHLLTLSAAGRIWSIYGSNTIYDNLLMIPVFILLTIFVGAVSYHLVEKPLLMISRRIV